MIKVTAETDKVCVAKVHEAGQSHVFDYWDELSSHAQRRLISDLRSINFQQVKRLIEHRRRGGAPDLDLEALRPISPVELPGPGRDGALGTISGNGRHPYADARLAGEEALAGGKVALVMLSGGVGKGVDGQPTGTLAVGPVTGKSLFQLHAEKVRALNRRYRTTLHWYIVTHPDWLEATAEYFRSHGHFGLNPSALVFLPQPQLPLVDRRGKFVLTEPGRLALRPNGHGGIIEEFLDASSLVELTAGGVEHFFFFQVDNPLVSIADPVYVGVHVLSGAEVSSKAVDRLGADEEIGIFCRAGDLTGIISYSEMPVELRARTTAQGRLEFAAGNIAAHLFRADFFARLSRENLHLPFHAVERCVPYLNRRGQQRCPTAPNCFEFSCFVFDALWLASSSAVYRVHREDEFAPIRDVGAESSLESARRAISRLYTRWLERCGASIRAAASGSAPRVEVSPLFALDEDELRGKIESPLEVADGLLLAGG